MTAQRVCGGNNRSSNQHARTHAHTCIHACIIDEALFFCFQILGGGVSFLELEFLFFW